MAVEQVAACAILQYPARPTYLAQALVLLFGGLPALQGWLSLVCRPLQEQGARGVWKVLVAFELDLKDMAPAKM